MSNYTDRFREIMTGYKEELEKSRKNRKITSGIFGFGGGPGDDPCHDAMDKQVGGLTAEIAEETVESEEISELVTAILREEKNREWSESAKWSVIAIQRYTIPLIPKIPADRKKEIDAWYEKAYPKRMRLPIQRQIVKELNK